MATIVCAIDDSGGAAEAARIARRLSNDFRARLVLAHAAGGWADGTTDSLTTTQARTGGNVLLERVAREQNLQAERRVEIGEPAATLAAIAAEEAATIILIGSSRNRWRRHKLRSGLASDLIVTAPCPVVVVPPPLRQ